MGSGAWDRLYGALATQVRWLSPPLPAGPGVCPTCHGPARTEYLRCFHCALHAQSAPGLLADAVVPVSYAVKGTKHAQDLWLYKSSRRGAAAAQAALLSLLLVFLRGHGACTWRLSGGASTRVAVVPSTRGRRGPHPLQALMAPVLALPWVTLRVAPQPDPPDPDDRDLSLDRFTAHGRLSGARVLLLDDTWTTGSRAQSAAAALKLAGASRVAAVLLGRHLDMREDGMDWFGERLRDRRYVAGPHGLWPCPAVCLGEARCSGEAICLGEAV